MKSWYDPKILDEYSYRERIEGALKWILLPRLKAYLDRHSLDGKTIRQEMRSELREIIDKIDELQKKMNEETDW
jgi:uncharacterized protein YqcC (DUF446 family)